STSPLSTTTTPLPTLSTTAPLYTTPQPTNSIITGGSVVSVCKDAVYFVPSSRGSPCTGSGTKPTGTACPIKGDQAYSSCSSVMFSYTNGRCIAPENAICTTVISNIWGCVFPSVGCFNIAPVTPSPTTKAPTSSPTPTPTSSKRLLQLISNTPSTAPETIDTTPTPKCNSNIDQSLATKYIIRTYPLATPAAMVQTSNSEEPTTQPV
ncbi:carbohydrate-binding protein, partial [Thraustotheca clavata]